MHVRRWLRRRQKALLIEAALSRGLLLGLFWLGLLFLRGLSPATTRFEALLLFLTLWLGSLGLSLLLVPPCLDLLDEDRELGLGMALPTLLEAERCGPSAFTPLLRSWVEPRIPKAPSFGHGGARKNLRRWTSILLLLLALLFWLLILPGGHGGPVPDKRPGSGHHQLNQGPHPAQKPLPPKPKASPKKPKQGHREKQKGKRNKPPQPRPQNISIEDKVVLPAFRRGKGESERKAPRFARAPEDQPGGKQETIPEKQLKPREEERLRAEWRERLKRSLERGKLSSFEAEWLRAWGRTLEKGRSGGGRVKK